MIKENNTHTSLENQIFNLREQPKFNSGHSKFHSDMESHKFNKSVSEYSKKTNELQDMFHPIYNSPFIVVETFTDSGSIIPAVDVRIGTFKNDEKLIAKNMVNETLDIQTNLNVHYKLQSDILIPEAGNISIPVNANYRNMNDILRTQDVEQAIPQAGTVNIYLGKVAADYISHAMRERK
jgi:hypothetical protein